MVRLGQYADALGSSPLTRGKRFGVGAGLRLVRLIPAHAGKTISEHANSDPAQAHPRSRGENGRRSRYQVSTTGSSPLTRGKPWVPGVVWETNRLIPAHAGKTRLDVGRASCSWAHPRSRGENHRSTMLPFPRGGSSPLTRGKPFLRPRTRTPTRLIPAHAGKTTSLLSVVRN